MAKMEILIRVYREVIESKIFAGEMDSVTDDQIDILMDSLREAVEVATKSARIPLTTCALQQTESSPTGIGGFNAQFGFDLSSFQTENNNTGDSTNISMQKSSIEGQNQPGTTRQDGHEGLSLPGNGKMPGNEFESGQHHYQMFDGFEAGMQSSGMVNTTAPPYFGSEFPLETSKDSLEPIQNLDFYSAEPVSMPFDLEAQSFDGNWQFSSGPLENNRFN
jgi:hypothetical protein